MALSFDFEEKENEENCEEDLIRSMEVWFMKELILKQFYIEINKKNSLKH